MKKLTLIMTIILIGKVFSWDLAGHKDITHDVIYNEPIKSLLENDFDFMNIEMQNITLIASVTADLEENKNIILWSDVANWEAFKNKFRNIEASCFNIGLLLHDMQDAAVPINHAPANEYNIISDYFKKVSNFREFTFETISLDNSMFTYNQLGNDFNNLPLENKYFTKPFTKLLLNKDIVVEESFEELYNNMINEFLLLTQDHVQKWKDRFGDRRWLEIQYHELRPPCVDAAFTLSREILYVYLLCNLNNAWDNPDKLLHKKVDMSAINMLLLD